MANKRYDQFAAGTYDITKIFLQADPVTGQLEKIFIPSPGVWGLITGSLASQLDLAAALAGKEPVITAGTNLQYWRGDKVFATLNTLAVPELTNLYFTDARARSAISLTTSGSSGASTYNSSTGVLNIPNYVGASAWLILGNSGTGSSNFVGTTDAVAFRIRTNNTERLHITSAGLVGINVTPTSQLHVKGAGQIMTVESTSPTSYMGFTGSTGSGAFFGYDSPDAFIQFTGSAGMRFYNGSNAVVVTMTTGGKIGIGTTGPTALLNFKAGTATANTAPLKFTAGTLLTTVESGVLETNSGNELFYTAAAGTNQNRGFVAIERLFSDTSSRPADANNDTINFTANACTLTLPTAVGIQGRKYTIKNSGTGVCGVATTSSQTIDGSTTYALATQYKYVTVQSDGANWIIIGNN